MKAVFLISLGFLVGFLFFGTAAKRLIAVVAGAREPINVAGSVSPSTPARGPEVGRTGDPDSARSRSPLPEAPIGKPARSRPFAFSFFPLFGRVPSQYWSLPPEVRSRPEIDALYRRVLISQVEDFLSPMITAVGLTEEQFDGVVAVATEAAIADNELRPDYGKIDREELDLRRQEIGRRVEAGLEKHLSAEQIELLAESLYSSSDLVSLLDAFAERGMPLTRDQLRGMLKPAPWPINGVTYVQQRLIPDPDAPGLTADQRRYLAMVVDMNDRRWLGQSLRVKVRDPDLFEIWPW